MSEAYYPCNLCGVSVRRGEQGKHLLTTCSHTRPDFVNKATLLAKLRTEVEGLYDNASYSVVGDAHDALRDVLEILQKAGKE